MTSVHVPIRTCVGCRVTAPQHELVRIVLVDGRAVVDRERRAPGRGAWVHPVADCVTGARRGGLARSFKSPVVADLDLVNDGRTL